MFWKICDVGLARLVLLPILLAVTVAASPVQGAVLAEVLSSWRSLETPVDTVFSLDGKRVFVLTEKNNVLIYSADGRLEGTIPVSAGFNSLDVSPNGESLSLVNRKEKMFRTVALNFQVKLDVSESPFLGPAEAPVIIVIFSDFQCPSCAQITPVIEQLLEDYPGRVKTVFKNFPLPFHPVAAQAALAALAAGEQGRFWEFHDRLFEHSAELSHEKITEIAQGLGLDMARFTKDMASESLIRRVNQDINEARQVGVAGTPTVFVNGWRLKEGSTVAFKKMIDQELQKTKNEPQRKVKE